MLGTKTRQQKKPRRMDSKEYGDQIVLGSIVFSVLNRRIYLSCKA